MAVDDDDDDATDGPEPAALQLPDPLEVSLMDETLPTGVKVSLSCRRHLRCSSSAAAPVGAWIFLLPFCRG